MAIKCQNVVLIENVRYFLDRVVDWMVRPSFVEQKLLCTLDSLKENWKPVNSNVVWWIQLHRIYSNIDSFYLRSQCTHKSNKALCPHRQPIIIKFPEEEKSWVTMTNSRNKARNSWIILNSVRSSMRPSNNDWINI